jgi:hypothetical protein
LCGNVGAVEGDESRYHDISLHMLYLKRANKMTYTVLGTASKLITRELSALNIHLPPLYPTQAPDRPLLSLPMDVPDLPTDETLINFGTYGDTVLLDHFYLNGQADGSMGYNLLDMPPETYEAFSQVEPLSVIMDPGFDGY